MDTLELLKAFINQHVDNPPENLRLDSRLDAIGVDSLVLLELMFDLEDKYGIRLPSDLPQPQTVGQLVDIFERFKPAAVNE